MLTAPLKAGESPRVTPVMIPTHTSKAPAAAVERSFTTWFTQSNLFPRGLLRVSRELLVEWLTPLFTREPKRGESYRLRLLLTSTYAASVIASAVERRVRNSRQVSSFVFP